MLASLALLFMTGALIGYVVADRRQK